MCLVANSELKNDHLSSFKLKEIHIVDSRSTEDPRNIIFSRVAVILGEERPENLGKIGNNRDITMQIRGWLISKENISPNHWYQNSCDASLFQHATPNFGRKKLKFDFQVKISPFFRVLTS